MTFDKTIGMNDWGVVNFYESIGSWNFFGCTCICIQTYSRNALFHYDATDTLGISKIVKKYLIDNKKYIYKIRQFYPKGQKVKNNLTIRNYEPNIFYKKDKTTLNICNMLNINPNEIPTTDIDWEKSKNCIGIFQTKIKTFNLKINSK